jgi:hypothetical protein
MDDFTKGLGTRLMLLLWHGATDSLQGDRTARAEVIARVVDGLRSDSFEHEPELAEIVQEFVSGFRGAPDQNLAAQFGSDLLATVAGEQDAGEFLKRVDAARESIPKLRLSAADIRLRKERVERSKRRALILLSRLEKQYTQELRRTQSSNQVAPPNRRPASRQTVRTSRRGGGR